MQTLLPILLILSAVLLIFLALYGFHYRNIKGARTFALLMAAMAVHTGGYSFELTAKTFEAMLFWLRVEYMGIAFYPVLILAFLRAHGDERHLVPTSAMIGSTVFATLTILFSHLYPASELHFTSIHYITRGPFSYLSIHYGPWYYLHTLVLIAVLVYASAIFLRKSKAAQGMQKLRLRHSAMGFALPVLAAPFHFYLKQYMALDIWPLLFIPMSLLIFSGLKRYDIHFLSQMTQQMIVDAIDEAVMVVDNEGYIFSLNAAAKAPGSPLAQLKIGCLMDEFMDADELMGGESEKHFSKNDRHYHLRRLVVGESFGHLLILNDETDIVNARNELHHLAHTDGLTGLYNRRHFDTALSNLDCRGVCVMLDIDHFKRINDEFGHLEGDKVLQLLAQALEISFPNTLKARFGGEEFALLFTDTTFSEVEGQLRDFNGLLGRMMKKSHGITVSMGVFEFDTQKRGEFIAPGEFSKYLLHQVDTALYRAKDLGRNRIEIS